MLLKQSYNARVVVAVPAFDESFNLLTTCLGMLKEGDKFQIGCVQGSNWAKGFPFDVPGGELTQLLDLPFGVTAWLPADEPMFRFSGAGEYVQLAVQKGGEMSKSMVRKADLQTAIRKLLGTDGSENPGTQAS